MPKKNVPSTIDRLPLELQELIGRLRREGRTIDEILAKLHELEEAQHVSRSALGRHVKSLAQAVEQVRQSRAVAEALVSQLGEAPDNKLQRANLELMHGVVMQALTAVGEDEDGNAQAVTFDPMQTMFLAKALQSLSSAEKTNEDRVRKAREIATSEAAKRAGAAGKARGLTKETVEFITQSVLGTQ